MRICVATTSFPRWPGDSRGTFIWQAAQALAQTGVDVCVVAAHAPGAGTAEQMGPITVFRTRYAWPERLEILQRDGGGLPTMWRRSWLARALIWPFLASHTLEIARRAHSCDLIHAQWTLSAAAAVAGQPWHGCPVVATVHGSDIAQAARLPVIRTATALALGRCRRVIAVSHALADQTRALGLPPEHVQVIPDGVDTTYFSPGTAPREPWLVFVGALIPIKGVHTLIEAWSQVHGEFPAYRLAIIGDGPERDALTALAEARGVSGRVAFKGMLPPEQVRDWMRRASLVVLPSLEEGLGVVLLEALACGTPCVASCVGGIPDVVTSEVGRLTPPGDSAALAAAIKATLQDTIGWANLSRQARERAEQVFSWPKIARQLLEVYADMQH